MRIRSSYPAAQTLTGFGLAIPYIRKRALGAARDVALQQGLRRRSRLHKGAGVRGIRYQAAKVKLARVFHHDLALIGL